ncbi:MAG: electron transfer flavoprotein subunit alpha/FixB family protein [Actinobacteria bacterium]|nr:electron transfer flavoprotein subunit alpha/FixB family protein [Actinomycetota bacterium]
MSTDIWVVVDSRDGIASDASLAIVTEAATLAATCGGSVVAVAIGQRCDEVAAQAGAYGAGTVRIVEGAAYAQYSTQAWTSALAALVTANAPGAVLFAATALGSDLAPRLAARLGTGLVSDVTALSVAADGRLTFTKNTLGGNLLTQCVVTSVPQIGTVRTGLYKKGAPTGRAPQVVREDVPAPAQVGTQVLSFTPDASDGELALEDADIVVSGGRAMGSAEGFAVLRALAAAFGPGAAVGASRPAADAGWLPTSQEIGISGKTVSPDLYLACGISGASQHLAGMSGSKLVVAVNSDAQAPIFEVADLGVVGDLFEIVPALTDAVARHRG